MKKLLNFSVLMLILTGLSCSSDSSVSTDDDGGNIPDDDDGISIEECSECLEKSHSKPIVNQQVTLVFYDENGNDVSQDATFFVDDAPISGNTFTSDIEGVVQVYATYENFESEPDQIEFFMPKRKVTFEDYTGAWCGWCPRVTEAVQILKETSDDVVVVAIHNGDPMAKPFESQLRNQFGVNSFPHARLDRTTKVPSPENGTSSINFVLNDAGSETDMSIAIDTELTSDSDLDINVKVNSLQDLSEYKVIVYVLQHGLTKPQANYYNSNSGSIWYGMGDPITDFVHDDVLEASLTNVFGDAIESEDLSENGMFTKNYQVDLSDYTYTNAQIPDYTFDTNNFGVAVYVVDNEHHTLNAQHVKAGSSVDFE